MKFDERFWISVAVIGSALLFDVLAYLLPTKADANLVAQIVSVWTGIGVVAVVQYWLGSSKGSQDKDATIHELSKGP